MCEGHLLDDGSWIRRKVLGIMSGNASMALRFYMFLAAWTKLPIIGTVLRFFCDEYGRYCHGGKTATLEECIELVATAKAVTVVDCACRNTFDNCSKTRNTCMTINTASEVFAAHSNKNPRRISIREAKELLHECHQEGLMHAVHHCIAPNEYAICNCCSCCCVPLRQRNEYNITTGVVPSSWEATVNLSSCKACGKCEKICPVQAVKRSVCIPDVQTGASVDADKCLGCGLCVDSCPSKAITLIERQSCTTSLIESPLPKWQLAILYSLLFCVVFPLAWGYKLIAK